MGKVVNFISNDTVRGVKKYNGSERAYISKRKGFDIPLVYFRKEEPMTRIGELLVPADAVKVYGNTVELSPNPNDSIKLVLVELLGNEKLKYDSILRSVGLI